MIPEACVLSNMSERTAQHLNLIRKWDIIEELYISLKLLSIKNELHYL